MYNLLLSLAAALIVSTALRLASFNWVAVIVPGVLAGAVAYVVLNLRVQKKLAAIAEAAVAEAQARRLDRAIQVAREALPLGKWVFGAEGVVSAMIGQFHWFKNDVEAAVPFLERAPNAHWQARVMLAVARWRKRDLKAMEAVLEEAAKSRAGRKQGLLWATYAWLLDKEGRHGDAVAVLGRGMALNPTDEKLKKAQQAAQNGKKLPMAKIYEMEWYQFGIEMPSQLPPRGFRPNRRAMYR